jgi:hypothetical protein
MPVPNLSFCTHIFFIIGRKINEEKYENVVCLHFYRSRIALTVDKSWSPGKPCKLCFTFPCLVHFFFEACIVFGKIFLIYAFLFIISLIFILFL